MEKCVYEKAEVLGLPVPRLLESNDEERTLHIEYIPGASISWPCEDSSLLPPVMSFFDVFKEINFAPAVALFKMDGERIHKYRLDQLQFIFPDASIWQRLDTIYETFLRDIPYSSIPFDRLLKNTLLWDGTLYFFDAEADRDGNSSNI